MAEVLNFYVNKVEGWTAEIVTDETGVVLDCEIHFKPTSPLKRRVTQRPRFFKQRPRVELPEEVRSGADVGAWL